MGSALAVLSVIIFGGPIGVPVGARSAQPDARGKTVPYLTFGIGKSNTNQTTNEEKMKWL